MSHETAIPATGRREPDPSDLLVRTAEIATRFLASLDERPVHARADVETLRRRLRLPLRDEPMEPLEVIEQLAEDADDGILASAGPRFFGFVIGGSLPVAVAADWLTSAWDQNAGLYVCGPAAAVVEEAVGDWLVDLFGLPAGTGIGLTTGCQMAHFTGLAAARGAVLRHAGWDAEANGLFGAPAVEVVVGAHAHSTVLAALGYLGLGRDRVHRVATDAQGRIQIDALDRVLDGIAPDAPLIVCLQAGEVNSGAFDPFSEAIQHVRSREGAWIHVDGAFGLWACTVPEMAAVTAGIELADSWATDAHKWLNVPYDSGIALVRDAQAHAAAMSPPHAPYLQYTASQERDEVHWVPEFSRRARGFTVYAALRSLGRRGVRDLVAGSCRLARLMAERVAQEPGVHVLNDVVLNQVLVRFGTAGPDEAADDLTRRVITPGPGRRCPLAVRDHLGRPRRHADLRLQLGDDRRGRDPVCGGDPGCVPSGSSAGSARVADAAGPAVLVEPPVQVQTLQDELDAAGDGGRRLPHLQAADGAAQLGDLLNERAVGARRHVLADLGRGPRLEALDERRHLREGEVAVEDVERGAGEELLDDAVLSLLIAQRLELDLPGCRGDDRGQVADPRRGGCLAQANGALERHGGERLGVGDA